MIARSLIDARLPHWRRLLQQLIRTPSEFEQEHAITALIEQHLQSLGVAYQRVAHDPAKLHSLAGAQPPVSSVPGRHSLAVRLPGAGRGASLAINVHLDTVPVGEASAWTHHPLSGHIDPASNVIYGRGAMDDKAGVVISLAVLEILAKSEPLAGDVVFHYVLEDETTGNGTLLCLEAGFTAEMALIVDGTRLDSAIRQHAGNVQFELAIQGRPASVSVSHMGVNAAEMAARLVIQLRDEVFALNALREDPWTRFPSPFQCVVQKLAGEGAQLTVPERATATCYLTFPPPFTLATMREFIESRVREFVVAHALPTPPAVAWNGFATEPVESDTRKLEQILAATAGRLGMQPIRVGPSTGTSDLRHFAVRGIPCLLYGPGRGFNPHRPDEHYHLDDLATMIHFYLDACRSACGVASQSRQAA
jgi:acetylornithine deacetylase